MQSEASTTQDDLPALFQAKREAQAVYSASVAACRQGEQDGLTDQQQIVLDLARREALHASCKADAAYHDALDRFNAAKQAAA